MATALRLHAFRVSGHRAKLAFAAGVAAMTAGALFACSSSEGAPLDPVLVGNDGAAARPEDAGVRDAVANAPDADADAEARDCLSNSLADAGGLGCPAACADRCQRIAARYILGVAEAAHACIRRLESCSEDGEVIPCVDEAMLRACPSPTAPAACGTAVAACDPDALDGGQFAGGGSITLEGCAVFASALSDTGRADYLGCLQRATDAGDCATSGSAACADEIRQ